MVMRGMGGLPRAISTGVLSATQGQFLLPTTPSVVGNSVFTLNAQAAAVPAIDAQPVSVISHSNVAAHTEVTSTDASSGWLHSAPRTATVALTPAIAGCEEVGPTLQSVARFMGENAFGIAAIFGSITAGFSLYPLFFGPEVRKARAEAKLKNKKIEAGEDLKLLVADTRYIEALELYRKSPLSSLNLLLMGIIAMHRGDNVQAKGEFERAMDVNAETGDVASDYMIKLLALYAASKTESTTRSKVLVEMLRFELMRIWGGYIDDIKLTLGREIVPDASKMTDDVIVQAVSAYTGLQEFFGKMHELKAESMGDSEVLAARHEGMARKFYSLIEHDDWERIPDAIRASLYMATASYLEAGDVGRAMRTAIDAFSVGLKFDMRALHHVHEHLARAFREGDEDASMPAIRARMLLEFVLVDDSRDAWATFFERRNIPRTLKDHSFAEYVGAKKPHILEFLGWLDCRLGDFITEDEKARLIDRMYAWAQMNTTWQKT